MAITESTGTPRRYWTPDDWKNPTSWTWDPDPDGDETGEWQAEIFIVKGNDLGEFKAVLWDLREKQPGKAFEAYCKTQDEAEHVLETICWRRGLDW